MINFNGTSFSAAQTSNNLVNFNGASMCTVVNANTGGICYDCQCLCAANIAPWRCLDCYQRSCYQGVTLLCYNGSRWSNASVYGCYQGYYRTWTTNQSQCSSASAVYYLSHAYPSEIASKVCVCGWYGGVYCFTSEACVTFGTAICGASCLQLKSTSCCVYTSMSSTGWKALTANCASAIAASGIQVPTVLPNLFHLTAMFCPGCCVPIGLPFCWSNMCLVFVKCEDASCICNWYTPSCICSLYYKADNRLTTAIVGGAAVCFWSNRGCCSIACLMDAACYALQTDRCVYMSRGDVFLINCSDVKSYICRPVGQLAIVSGGNAWKNVSI